MFWRNASGRKFCYKICGSQSRAVSKPLVCGDFGPHPHAHCTKIIMCGAHTCTPFFQKKFQRNFFFWFFLLLNNIFLQKMRVCRHGRTLEPNRGAHTHPHAHFWKFFRTHLHKNCRTHTCVSARTLTKGLYVSIIDFFIL